MIDRATGETVADLVAPGEELIVARGGTGGKGNALLLFGISLASIDGAGRLVTDETAMARLYSHLGIGISDRIPYFEVLLEKKPSARNYEIIAYRIIKNP